MTETEIDLYEAIDEIIWNDWDAIGVNDTIEARDEYFDYLPVLFKMLMEDQSLKTISGYLYKLSTEHMGLFGNRIRDFLVAEQLIQAKTELFNGQ